MRVDNIKPQVDPFVFPVRHGASVLASGRLLNLGYGSSRCRVPSSTMYCHVLMYSVSKWRHCTSCIRCGDHRLCPRKYGFKSVSMLKTLLLCATRVPLRLLRLCVPCDCGQRSTASDQFEEGSYASCAGTLLLPQYATTERCWSVRLLFTCRGSTASFQCKSSIIPPGFAVVAVWIASFPVRVHGEKRLSIKDANFDTFEELNYEFSLAWFCP